MKVHFSDSYVDGLFDKIDLDSTYHLISVVGGERSLPEEFWIFCRIFEWAPARSGVWQYYEGLPEDKFERVVHGLQCFGLLEIAAKYRLGKSIWEIEDQIDALDTWLDGHAEQIHHAVFELIDAQRDSLKGRQS